MSSVIVCNTSLFYDYNVKTQSKFDKKKFKKTSYKPELVPLNWCILAKYKETEASFK